MTQGRGVRAGCQGVNLARMAILAKFWVLCLIEIFRSRLVPRLHLKRIKQAYMPVLSLLRLGESRGELLICLI